MIRIKAPLFCLTAQGWLGNYTYKMRGVVPSPYPLGLLGHIRFPYRMPAFGLKPYGPFIAQYYSNIGWCYQRRRTWHGIVYTPMKPPISKHINTPLRAPQKIRFAQAYAAWKLLSPAEKDYWERERYPVHCQGVNRWIRNYIKTHPIP